MYYIHMIDTEQSPPILYRVIENFFSDAHHITRRQATDNTLSTPAGGGAGYHPRQQPGLPVRAPRRPDHAPPQPAQRRAPPARPDRRAGPLPRRPQ
jgi:hypothetical protein